MERAFGLNLNNSLLFFQKRFAIRCNLKMPQDQLFSLQVDVCGLRSSMAHAPECNTISRSQVFVHSVTDPALPVLVSRGDEASADQVACMGPPEVLT